ncbi:TetR/AcrR family transcriptional regulator [uncultured Amnibacterium sp.]|uniref:TetR/AcrR family transcriptional regulator n=1 Tax=uncultured Amnibacterium sp. TaxID=1631851 RepID=UPI0035CA0F2D
MSTLDRVVRWEPGARERLQGAAIALFVERGYEQTTVQDIAGRAGLTERTFFRHFADKREVLFVGQDEYAAHFLRGVAEAPDAAPFGLAVAAITAAADFFPEERRPWSRHRQTVIDANAALQERELLKRASLVTTLTAALRDRGVAASDASLAAETAVAAFHVAFRRWIAEGEDRSLLEIEQEVLGRLAAIVPAAAS